MLSNMKRRAREGGVTFIQGALQDMTLTPSKTAISSAAVQDESGQVQQLSAGTFVMAAGAWAAASGMDKVVQRLGGIGTFGVWPVRPRRRCIFNFHCPSATEHGVDRAGLTVDPSGVYFRPEGKGSDKFICGVRHLKKSNSKRRGPDCTSTRRWIRTRLLEECRQLTISSSAMGFQATGCSKHQLPGELWLSWW